MPTELTEHFQDFAGAVEQDREEWRRWRDEWEMTNTAILEELRAMNSHLMSISRKLEK